MSLISNQHGGFWSPTEIETVWELVFQEPVKGCTLIFVIALLSRFLINKARSQHGFVKSQYGPPCCL
ncbi:hypothetical protein RchiOBHm_Chr4g0405591 [Rosa chinensis]|uniref:Uncharacterized protein n=1 Tax=Rosa chinensis TaxID=74649 RepID=A0A2P6QU55_ROSCH|nr:hypothetical protein RchiOBHm_Chr4g0405591 [Rosa chinensis]